MASKTSKVCALGSLYTLVTHERFRSLVINFMYNSQFFFLPSQDNGLTPLMLAARDNKHNIVEKLLELGAVVTDRDKASTVK